MIVLETERLILRRLTRDDVDELAALYADPDVMRHFEGTRTREQAAAEIEEILGWYERAGVHFWGTILRENGRFIGRCGLLPQMVEGCRDYEVAYMLARSCWGRGLATEAARAIRDHGLLTLGFRRVISLIDPRNHASIRVAEKNGMRCLGNVEVNGWVDRLYAVERSERLAPDSATADPPYSRFR